MPDIANIKDLYGGFNMNEEAEALDEKNTCCHASMAIWLIICNSILIVLSIACFGVGIWISTQPAFSFTAGSLGAGCIFMGLFLLLIGALGICAACRKSKCGLGIYSTLLTIFVIGEIAALGVAVGATGVAVSGMNETWKVLSDDYQDTIGLFYGCCGVPDASPNLESLLSLTGAEVAGLQPWDICQEENPVAGTETALSGVCEIQGLVWEAESESKAVFATYSNNFITDDVLIQTAAGIGLLDTPTYASFCTADKMGAAGSWDVDPNVLAICSCAYDNNKVSEGTNPVDSECRNRKGMMPLCNGGVDANGDDIQIADSIPFEFAAGVANQAVAQNTLPAVANCYAKFENWLAGNMGGTIAVLVILFLYQLFNVTFACMLWCGCCGGKNKSDETGNAEENAALGVTQV